MRDKLHRLRTGKSVDFKLCLLVYKAVHGLATDHIAEMYPPVGCIELVNVSGVALTASSSSAGNLIVPATNTKYGQ